MQSIYIFKFTNILKREDKQKIREDILQQIIRGVVVLDPYISYVGREIEISGHKVKVELIESSEIDSDCQKKRAEAYERAIKHNKPCWACKRRKDCGLFEEGVCMDNGGQFWQFDEARFAEA